MTIDANSERLLLLALEKRKHFVTGEPTSAWRAFNGFFEGDPSFSVDIYGQTVVLHDHSKKPDQEKMLQVAHFYQNQLPFITCAVIKARYARNLEARAGIIAFGGQRTGKILENGVWYKVDLLLNQDASFYLDTLELRAWLKTNSQGKDVLNTFAYTGSLGVAALAGGANRVTQLDLNHRFLDLSIRGAELNDLDTHKIQLIAMDFFLAVGRLKKSGRQFDTVILDPPFYSSTQAGTVDLNNGMVRLINKVRPLIRDGGTLVCLNNALFQSGRQMMDSLSEICKDGYVSIGQRLDVPADFFGFSSNVSTVLPSDPYPFNHSTKIILLNIRKKDS